MFQVRRALLILAALCVVTRPASAQHADIEVTAVDGKLLVAPSAEGYVFEGELGETIPNFGAEPGFEADDGELQAGDELGFNLVSSLLYWDGSQFTSPPHQEQLTISKSVFAALVTPDSGPQSGFVFATADDEGGLHEDLEFLLARPDSHPDTATGAFGLWLELSSPQYESSNNFIIMLNNGLPDDEFEAGVAAAAQLVPEPASLGLFAIAVLAGIVWRSVALRE